MNIEEWKPTERPYNFNLSSSQKLNVIRKALDHVPATSALIMELIAACSRFDFNNLLTVGRLFEGRREVVFSVGRLYINKQQKKSHQHLDTEGRSLSATAIQNFS